MWDMGLAYGIGMWDMGSMKLEGVQNVGNHTKHTNNKQNGRRKTTTVYERESK